MFVVIILNIDNGVLLGFGFIFWKVYVNGIGEIYFSVFV